MKRYSELLTFHKLLEKEMKEYFKKKGYSSSDFPEFPPKKLLFNKDPQFIQKRVMQMNNYFDELFQKFPAKVPYTNAIIDLCLPFKLNIAVIGKQKCGKTSYIEAIIKLMTEKFEEKN